MVIRKVQVTGGSSYIVSLPKEWIVACNIEKGDELKLEHQPDGTLLIIPIESESHMSTVIELNLDSFKSEAHLYRHLVGLYKRGFSKVILRSSRKIPPVTHETVRSFIESVMGPEIIEEETSSITMKDLLNPTEMPFDKAIRRMFNITKNMLEHIKTALDTLDVELAKSMIKRDDEVDKLHWLIARQMNLIMSDFSMAREMNTTHLETTFYYQVGRIIERIADHSCRIAYNIFPLHKDNTDVKVIKSLVKAAVTTISLFIGSMDAWFKKAVNSAQECIDTREDLYSRCDEISRMMIDQRDVDWITAVGHIIESIRRIGEYSFDISELVIERLI